MFTSVNRLFSGLIMYSGRNSHVNPRGHMGRDSYQQHVNHQSSKAPSFSNSGKKNNSSEYDREGQNRAGQKRRGSNLDVPPDKRIRSSSSAENQHNASSSAPVVSNNFIVPVSHGTEKITMAVWNYFMGAQMTDDDLKKKLLLRKSLLSILTGAFPNCRLFMVGSSMTGFATRTSDIDMCLMITQDEMDQKRDATVILNSIARALKQCSFVRQSQVIRAKVPILKFYDQVSGVECDLNINNIVGIRNTHLLRHYAYMDWRVRPLMLFIKRWARFHDINDASKKSISSYSLSLMLIHYLQSGVTPPVLPCLQKMKPDMFSVRTDVRKLSLSLEDKVAFTSNNQATLGELLLGFLNYYSNVFRFEDQVISVRRGKCVSHSDVSSLGDSMQWKFLNIEEPFEGTNTARSVYDLHVFTRVLRVFKVSFKCLEKTRDMESILTRPF